ncbi:MAG: serine/threonine-protein kinase, partial [Myxococcota bacterium]
MTSTTWTDVEGSRPAAPMVIANRYECSARVGRGGMGEVWRAFDRIGGVDVALKLIPALSSHQQDQVRRELSALRWLRLPGVVQLLDDGRYDARYFLVMPLVSGEPFLEGRGTWDQVARPVLELLENLARVHLAGVVHRDLKPANVQLDRDGHPVLLDFGVARGRAIGGGPGGVEGTPETMAPEQLLGRPCDGRADLYAVGAMVYRYLCGRWPHDGDMLARTSLPAEPIASRVAGVPPRVAEVIDQLLAYVPDDRPASAIDVLVALGGLPPPAFTPDGDAARPEDLRPLFHGSDGFGQAQQDAAHVLFERTAGRRERVGAELAGWIRAGLAHWQAERVAIDAVAVERLRAGLRLGTAPDRAGLSAAADALYERLQLEWPDAPIERGRAWDELVARGLAWPLPSGRAGVDPYVRGVEDRGAHLRVAETLPTGERRLRHLVAGDAPPEEVAHEARAVAERLREVGQLARAAVVAELGLAAAREARDAVRELALLTEYTLAQLAQGFPRALDRAQYELERAVAQGPQVTAIGWVVQAFRAAITGDPSRAESLLAELTPFDDPSLEVWRQGARVRAAARRSLEAEELLIAEIAPWARSGGGASWAAHHANWLGNLRYRQYEFRAAAGLFAQAASEHRSEAFRLAARVNEAGAWLDALELDQAAAAAAGAKRTARALRLAEHEARAVWVERAAAYRAERPVAARVELVDAAVALGPYHEGMYALTEAAIAWRAGDRATAGWLAGRAR